MSAPSAAMPCGLPMIIFDFDGTLVDSMGLCVRELEESFIALNLTVPDQAELEKCNGPTFEEAVHLLGVPENLHADFLRIRSEKQMELLQSCQRMYEGVERLLSVLSSAATLCIASNGRQLYLDKSIEHWGIGPYFTKIQGGDPSRTKGQLVADMIKEFNPVKAMMVGDRLTDILAGRENGIYTIAATYGFGSPLEWQEADCRASSVEALLDLCLQLCGR